MKHIAHRNKWVCIFVYHNVNKIHSNAYLQHRGFYIILYLHWQGIQILMVPDWAEVCVCMCVFVCACGSLCSDYSPHQHNQPAHADNTWHLHLATVPTYFSALLCRIVPQQFILFHIPPRTGITPPSVTVLRISRWGSDWSFPHKCAGPWTAIPFNSHQPALQKHWSGWERLREVDSAWMGEQTLGTQSLKMAFHATLREANWAVMRGTSPLSLTTGNSITSHANWPGLSFLGGNPGNS